MSRNLLGRGNGAAALKIPEVLGHVQKKHEAVLRQQHGFRRILDQDGHGRAQTKEEHIDALLVLTAQD